MSGRGEVMRGSTPVRVLLASMVLLVGLIVFAPRDVRGADSWKTCVDEAFVDYNNCLMESTSWFNQALCDINWELEVALCSAYIVGDIRKAYEEGSGAS